MVISQKPKPISNFLTSPYFVVAAFVILIAAAAIYYLSLNTVSAGTPGPSSTAPTSSDLKIDNWKLGLKEYSGTEVPATDLSKTDCKEADKTARLVVLTDFDLNQEKGEKRIETALSNSSTWTKRGQLYPVSQMVLMGIFDLVKKDGSLASIFGSPASVNIQNDLKDKIKSGVLFNDVPAGQDLNFQIYLLNNNYKAVAGTVGKIGACKTKIIFVKKEEPTIQKSEIVVCLHGPDQKNNFKPKQSFVLPGQQKESDDFAQKNPGTEIDLGPCQKDEAVLSNIEAGNKPSDPVAAVAATGNQPTAGQAQAPNAGGVSGANGAKQVPAIGAENIVPGPGRQVIQPGAVSACPAGGPCPSAQ